MSKRPGTLVICDMFPGSCIRLSHARFIVLQSKLPKRVRRFRPALLRNEIRDQYRADPQDLVGVLTSARGGSPQEAGLNLGTDRPLALGSPQCCFLRMSCAKGSWIGPQRLRTLFQSSPRIR